MGFLWLSTLLLALFMIDTCKSSPSSRHLICADLLSLYKKMPDLIRSLDGEECWRTQPNCVLINSLILEKGRERVYQLRKKLGCLPSAPELLIYDQDEVCTMIEEAPLYSTKLTKGFTGTPLGPISERISLAFQPFIADQLEPIHKRLRCEFRELDDLE